MKTFFKVFLSGVALAVFCSVLGGIVGALIGGNYGFPSIGDTRGYESGGLFFSVLGMVFGGTLGSWLASSRLQKAKTLFGQAIPVFFCGIVAIPGYSILVRSFNFPEFLDHVVLFAVFTAMPFIIARRAMRVPIAS